jgi:shikimate dehydrogenase
MTARPSVNGATQVLGIIGDPIEHSLSPPMQNAALASLGVNGVYVPFAVPPAELGTAISGLWSLGVQGFNVTIPHKQAVMSYLTSVTEIGEAVGAINTVWRSATGWAGTNTDVLGFMSPLEACDRNWTDERLVILGSGGAARAAVAGAVILGCTDIWVVGRSLPKLEQFVASWFDSPLQPALQICTHEAVSTLLPDTTVLVNSTPLGMAPRPDDTPVSAEQLSLLPEEAIAYDLIYTPSPTRFLKLAAQQGLKTFDGVEMLVQQGAAALEIWTQKRPPVAIMREVLKAQLGHS